MNIRKRGAVAVLAILAATGCFSEHTESMTGPDGPRVPDVECSVDFPTPGDDEVIVAIRDFAFHPSEISVSPGTRVTWINCEETGTAAHTATSDGGLWDSDLLSSGGATFTRVFQEAGTFPYHCTPHPFMQGTVEVEP